VLFDKIGEMNLAECLVLCPSKWHDEKCIDVTKHNFELHCLETVGKSFYTFRLRGLEQYIQEFQPDVIYIEEEPHTIQARECKKIAQKENIPYAVFSWENVKDRKIGEPFDSIEQEVIKSADVLIAGNGGAKRRLIARGGEEGKISICPQTGVDTSLWSPKDIVKTYDLVYHGRFVREKGVFYIQDVAKELGLEILWVGGRSKDFIPTYGTNAGLVDSYLKLPEWLSQAKIGVQFPYSHNGYAEQYNFGVAELMSIGLPVIISDNGSLREVYEGSPAIIVHEEDADALKKETKKLLRDEELRTELGRKGHEWVNNNLSLEVIGRKLVKILEGAM
jgi:glycosyltransferase involved in cell wall biosynthesis